ncbi:MAG: hypothetical protein FWH47_07860, partial [Methanomassiliicoccaceae archaeon]|nr:hypothetical protein [Methanomassiliicoccaceae archaeon]
DSGGQFKEWRRGAAVYTDAEISLTVTSGTALELYFDDGGDSFPWLIAGVALFLFLILLLLLLLWRRRRDEEEDGLAGP